MYSIHHYTRTDSFRETIKVPIAMRVGNNIFFAARIPTRPRFGQNQPDFSRPAETPFLAAEAKRYEGLPESELAAVPLKPKAVAASNAARLPDPTEGSECLEVSYRRIGWKTPEEQVSEFLEDHRAPIHLLQALIGETPPSFDDLSSYAHYPIDYPTAAKLMDGTVALSGIQALPGMDPESLEEQLQDAWTSGLVFKVTRPLQTNPWEYDGMHPELVKRLMAAEQQVEVRYGVPQELALEIQKQCVPVVVSKGKGFVETFMQLMANKPEDPELAEHFVALWDAVQQDKRTKQLAQGLEKPEWMKSYKFVSLGKIEGVIANILDSQDYLSEDAVGALQSFLPLAEELGIDYKHAA